MRKGATRTQAQQAIANLKRYKVFHRGNCISGFPHETPAQMEQTVQSAIELDLDAAMFAVVTPYPGTAFYEECLSQGILTSQDWDDYDAFKTVFKSVHPDIDTLRKKSYRMFWLRPDFVRQRLQPSEEISGISDLLATRMFKIYLQVFYDPVYGGPISWPDWRNLFDGLREFVNPQLATAMGGYSAEVKLDLDIGQACLRIQDGQYAGLDGDGIQAEVVVKAENEILTLILGSMTREPLSMLLLKQWRIDGSSEAVLDWLLWARTFQTVTDLSPMGGGPWPHPRCLSELTYALAKQLELGRFLELNQWISFNTGTHSLSFQVRDSRIVNLELTDKAPPSRWDIRVESAELVEALHGGSQRFVAWWAELPDDGQVVKDQEADRAILFPSDAWIKALAEALNKSGEYAKAASRWKGDFYFIIDPDGGLDQTVMFYIDLWQGRCREAFEVVDESQKKPGFRLRANHSTWKKIVSGQLDPGQGIATKQLKFKGNMLKLMRDTRAMQELVRCCAQVPTRFLD
jgi:putative sterol carrier protein